MKKLLKILFTLIFLIIILILYSRFIATKGLITKEYTIKDNITSDFDGIKIVHFSDLHYKRIITKKDIDKIINEINLINPDIVVFTGDLIDQDNDEFLEEDVNYLKEALSKINAKYGKYAIIGDHDYSIDISILRNIYKESNFILLENSYDIIYGKNNEKLFIGGLSTGSFSNTSIEKLSYNEECYKIFIMHEPDYIDEILSLNPNIVLAGHSHNGQINIPYLKKYFVPNGAKKYYEEHYLINNTSLYISSGIGVSRYNFRLFNHPSINFYRINKN